MAGYFRFVLAHRLPVVLVVLALTGLAGVSLSRAEMATSLGKLILGEHPAYRRYMERVAEFGSDEQLIVAWEAPDLATPEAAARLGRLETRLRAIDDVARVYGAHTAARFQARRTVVGGDGAGAGLDVELLAANPLARGIVVSEDRRHTAMIVELTPDQDRSLERTPAVVEEILGVFLAEGFERDDLHLGGLPAVLAEVNRQTRFSLLGLTPFVAVLLLLTTWLLFRRLWPVVVTLAVGALAIVWTMGFAIALDPQINVMLAVAPGLILIISFSDVVHLCSAYLLELSSGREKKEAILATATEVGTACFFTSLTTFVGFMGFSLVPVPAFRQMGIVLGFGVGVALLLAMTLVPILFAWMRPPKPWTASLRAGAQHRLDAVLHRLHRVATTRPWLVIAVFALATAVAVVGAGRITIETDITKRMSADNRLRRDAAYLDEHFAGTTVLDLYLELGDMFQLDLERIDEFQQALEAWPEVGRVVSVVSIARTLAAADPSIESWRSGAAMSMFAQAARGEAGAEVSRFVQRSGSGLVLRMSVVLRETGMSATYDVARRARELGRELLGEQVVVEPAGFLYLGGLWLQDNVRSQRRAVFISFALITLMIVVLLRSLTAGLTSMVPNVVPLLFLGGVLGFAWRRVDSDLAGLALIAIGIAVDDTIHFLTRYRTELARAGSRDGAIERTFTTAGRGIVMTSVIFAVGFAPCALSDYLIVRMIGILMPAVMIVALLADVLLLPALISVGSIRLRPRA